MQKKPVNITKNAVGKSNNKRPGRGFGRLVKIVMLGAIALSALWFSAHISEQIAKVEAETEQIQAQIQQALYLRQEIEDSAAFTQSREFIESVARNFLGLVHRDEIIFIIVD